MRNVARGLVSMRIRPSAPTDSRRVQILRAKSLGSGIRDTRWSTTTKSFPAPAILVNGKGSDFPGCVGAIGLIGFVTVGIVHCALRFPCAVLHFRTQLV